MGKGITYQTFLTVDTESNQDGSLYIISLHDMTTKQSRVFYSLDEYYKHLKTYQNNILIYVHNFGGWDSHFLIDEDVFSNNKLKQYKLIAKGKSIMRLTLRYQAPDKTKYHITYEDSLPRTMIGLKPFAKSIGKPYEDIDDSFYQIYRTPGQPETWPDRQKLEEYAIKDVEILADLVNTFMSVYPTFSKTLSAGSMVWKEMVQQYGSDKDAGKIFRKHFKALHPDIDRLIRPSYMGGITTPFWNAGLVLDRPKLKQLYPWFKDPIIRGDDISSAYAWAQVKELPQGEYRIIKALDEIKEVIHDKNTIVFMNIYYEYDAAKFPIIPKMHMNQVSEYEVDGENTTFKYNEASDYMHTMINGNKGYAAISSLDLRIALEEKVYKNLKYTILPFPGTDIYGIKFDLKKSKEMFDITTKYYDLKNAEKDNKAMRTAYKSPLVNLYGKLGERLYEDKNDLDIFTREIKSTPREKIQIPRYGNVAAAAVITSYVHHNLYYKGKEVGFKNMLYCDTDSMMYVCENGPIPDSVEELGVWNNELNNPEKALFICPKKYIIETDNVKVKWAAAGVTKNESGVPKEHHFTIKNWVGGQRHYYTRVKDTQHLDKGIRLDLRIRDLSESYDEELDLWLYANENVYE